MEEKPDAGDKMQVDLAAALGSDAGVSNQCFTVYVPNKDREGNEFCNQRKWVLEAIQLLCEVNGGATAMPPVEGGWLSDEAEIIWENPVLVYSFIRPDRFLQSLPGCASFCTAWAVKPTRVRWFLSLTTNSFESGNSTRLDGG